MFHVTGTLIHSTGTLIHITGDMVYVTEALKHFFTILLTLNRLLTKRIALFLAQSARFFRQLFYQTLFIQALNKKTLIKKKEKVVRNHKVYGFTKCSSSKMFYFNLRRSTEKKMQVKGLKTATLN